MDKGRRCYRMIGDVLVERTVAETLPAGEGTACEGCVGWGWLTLAGRVHGLLGSVLLDVPPLTGLLCVLRVNTHTAVQRNHEGLEGLIAALKQQYEGGSKALVAFQQKYKIRIGGGGGEDDEDGSGSSGKQQKQQQQLKQGGTGVLC
jgi:hypothetical protein